MNVSADPIELLQLFLLSYPSALPSVSVCISPRFFDQCKSDIIFCIYFFNETFE